MCALLTGLAGRVRSWFAPRQQPVDPPPYRAFTTEFDVTIEADKLDSVLGALSEADRAAVDEAVAVYSRGLEGWRTKVHVKALDASARIRRAVRADLLGKITVTVLIDLSGSMRGQSVLLAAAATDIASDFLAHLGVSVELLGFTTVGWQGGKSRQRWLRIRKPVNPGRLCDLLHIIYRPAEEGRYRPKRLPVRQILRPDLLRENVDGEAIEWAATRLRARSRPYKLLLVVSDGAPVDDSTLASNDPGILDRHLRKVIGELEQAKDVRTAAIGIGFDVGRYYSTAMTVATPDDLGEGMIGLLEGVITELRNAGN